MRAEAVERIAAPAAEVFRDEYLRKHRPVILQNLARLTLLGSNPAPDSSPNSRRALSIISCRSLRSLMVLSIVLLALAYWLKTSVGPNDAMAVFF